MVLVDGWKTLKLKPFGHWINWLQNTKRHTIKLGGMMNLFEKMPHLEKIIRDAMIARKRTLKLAELTPKRRKKGDRIRGLLPLLGNIDLIHYY